ncbi:SPOR domain-containing protein [Sphingoaurantiacus capsulatus]|uniref:SPOR domain-containing protein n=1 Tax=Sphingoaurantiacus capsulatus TaxID=1771310 RepID=A0ABV7XD11_9SPHN
MRNKSWIASLGAAAILIATPAMAGVKEGVEKWHAGDHKGAVAEWMPFAARGDADALFNLGQAYKLGRGVAKNENIALDYYRKAATRGHPPAQEKLGITLYTAADTKTEGMRWLEQAAKAGQARAQYVLGVAHFNGEAAAKNWPLAYAYMLRANNGGVPQSTTALATMNANISTNDRAKGEEIAKTFAAPPPIAEAEATAVAAATPPAPRAPMPAPTESSPLAVKTAAASPAPIQTAANGRWRVQLGAFSQRGMAVEAWTALKNSQPAVVAGAEPTYAEAGKMIRLQLGPFASKGDAQRLCGKLQTVGRNCFVVGS